MIKTYSKVLQCGTFEERFDYLKLNGKVGIETFGFDRYLNQKLYRSGEWKSLRNEIITRDNGCDLAFPDRRIGGRIYIHHINPIKVEDIVDRTDFVLNPDFLICCSKRTHDALHYGDKSLLMLDPVERKPGDTIPWR